MSRSGRLTAWACAWLGQQAAADDVLRAGLQNITAVNSSAGSATNGMPAHNQRHDCGQPLTSTDKFHTHAATTTADSPLDVLSCWRRSGVVRVVFPIPGDVRGLPGPTSFHCAAVQAGEAVLSDGLGLVPQRLSGDPRSSAYDIVSWHAYRIEALPADYVGLSDASHQLSEAIRESASALTAAQVARSTAEIGEQLSRWRASSPDLDLPMSFPPEAVALVAKAERLHALLEIVALDPLGGGIDLAGFSAREHALAPLIVAVRRARLAGYNALTELD